jgi:uncharacterized membrane protein
MEIETTKILGGVGAILMLIGMIPYSYLGVLELIGLILVMISLSYLAGYYKDKGIFNNALYGLIVGIVGGIVAIAVGVASVLASVTDFFYALFPGWNGDWTTLPGMIPDFGNVSMDVLVPLVTGIIAVLLIIWIVFIVGTFLARRSLVSLAAKSGVGLFSTAGLLLLIGALLLIIFVGVVIIWVALLIMAIGFFRIRAQQEPPPTPAAVPV